MSDVKRLLEEATPLPWIRPWAALTVRAGIANEDDVLQHQRNLDLAVAAVNALPDYLAAVEALATLVALWDGGMPTNKALQPLVDARAALRRLREPVSV